MIIFLGDGLNSQSWEKVECILASWCIKLVDKNNEDEYRQCDEGNICKAVGNTCGPATVTIGNIPITFPVSTICCCDSHLLNLVNCQDTEYNSDRNGFGSVGEFNESNSTSPSTQITGDYEYYFTDDGIADDGSAGLTSGDNATLPPPSGTVSPRQSVYEPVTQVYQEQFAQNQGTQQANCNTLGCQPPQVNQQEYLASAQQYSYFNVNFRPQQPVVPIQGQQSGFFQDGTQYYPNNQGFQGNQNVNQGQFAGVPQNGQNYQGNQGFPPQFDQNQGQTLSPEAPVVQKLTYVNIFNDTLGRPVVEQVNLTKTGDGQSNLTVTKTEFPNPDVNQQGPGFIPGGGIVIPPQQDQGFSQGYPTDQGTTSGGYFIDNQGPGMNNAGFPQQQPQRPTGQLIGANGVTTGGVIMAPDGQGVPLLVSSDYLQNNRLTGQIKVIDASYDPNQPFMDFVTFQRQNMYGNFAQLSSQFMNVDYMNVHIANAVYFNLDVATYPTSNQRYTLYPPNVFQNYVQSLGINQEDYLIIYSRDNLGGMRYAAAVWELFRIYNHSKVSVLNGGFNAWSSLGYEVTSAPTQVVPGSWRAGFDYLKVITFEEMAAIQPNGQCYFNEPDLFNFLDTRYRAEFNQNGRLFGSKNLPVDELVNGNGLILSATEINIALARANYTRGQTSFVLGNNGPEAAFGILALAVVGDDTARLYNKTASEDDVPMCTEDKIKNAGIYCGGWILKSVNYWKLYNDSKSFVDSPLKQLPNVTLANFEKLFGKEPNITTMDRDKLQEFVNEHFLAPGHELLECVPVGWVDAPDKLQKIKDPVLRQWAMDLNAIWKKLCKKMDPTVNTRPEQYSLLPVKYEFIAPGGRFLEPYYWDAYWIIKGLMASEMYEAAARMILNYADFVETYGFIPNGGRVYYLQRSQPPLFIPMVYEFYENTGNASFVKQLLPTMEKEFSYWMTNHKINVAISGQNYELYRYHAGSNVARPESYQQDVDTANNSSFPDKQLLFRDIASAAESGQDFSTRWFKDGISLTTIETTNILPVDLNSYLCWNMDILDYLFDEVALNSNKSEYYRNMLVKHRKAVHAVFYNNTVKAWLDYNLRTGKHNPNFYAPLAAPLFTMCYNSLDQTKAEGVFQFFKNANAFNYPSGIPESMKNNSGQQWDFPNGWGNINHIVIEGLRKSESPEMQDEAFEIAKKWIRGNYKVYNATGHMWEKYDVVGSVPIPGKGGEYNVQDGFGWTNGAILDLLVTYADRITLDDLSPGNQTTSNGSQNPTETVPIILTLFSASTFFLVLS